MLCILMENYVDEIWKKKFFFSFPLLSNQNCLSSILLCKLQWCGFYLEIHLEEIWFTIIPFIGQVQFSKLTSSSLGWTQLCLLRMNNITPLRSKRQINSDVSNLKMLTCFILSKKIHQAIHVLKTVYTNVWWCFRWIFSFDVL